MTLNETAITECWVSVDIKYKPVIMRIIGSFVDEPQIYCRCTDTTFEFNGYVGDSHRMIRPPSIPERVRDLIRSLGIKYQVTNDYRGLYT